MKATWLRWAPDRSTGGSPDTLWPFPESRSSFLKAVTNCVLEDRRGCFIIDQVIVIFILLFLLIPPTDE